MWLLLIYLGLLYNKQAPPLFEMEVAHSAGGEHYLREHLPCVCRQGKLNGLLALKALAALLGVGDSSALAVGQAVFTL